MERIAEELDLSASMVSLAADFYSAFPEEIDARIEANEQAAEQSHRPDGRDQTSPSEGTSCRSM